MSNTWIGNAGAVARKRQELERQHGAAPAPASSPAVEPAAPAAIPEPAEQKALEKTSAQKRDEAKALYDSYMRSDERKQNVAAAHKAQTDAWMTASITGREAPLGLAEDKKEKELKALVDHYEAQVQREESQGIMDADLQELAGWSQEERRALDEYILGKDRAFYEAINPTGGGPRARVLPEGVVGIINKYGQDKVDKLEESVRWSRNAELTQQTAEDARNGLDTTAGVLGHNVTSVAANTLGGVAGLFGRLQELGTRTGRYPTMDPNNIGNLPQVYAGAVRGKTAQNIEENIGGGWGKAASLGYQGVMSMADSYARALAGGGSVGAAALAASGTFSQTMSEASAQGATPGQAVLLATTKAAIEAASEKIPLDNLLEAAKTGGKGLGTALIDAFAQAGVEMTTEEISLFGSVLAEAAILKEKAGYQQQVNALVAEGMDLQAARDEAARGLLWEAAETAAVSGISGAASSAAATMAGNIRNSGNVETIRQQMNADGEQDTTTSGQDATTEKQDSTISEQARTDAAMEETAAQWGREASGEVAPKKSDSEITLDRAMQETFGREGNDQGSRAPDMERLRAQEESLRGAAEAYAGVGDTGRASEVEAERQGYAEKIRQTTEQEAARLGSITDRDAPSEPGKQYSGEANEDPFQQRRWEDVGSRKVKAYMAENPEVKPFIQEEARKMAEELGNTTKGERGYDERVHYESGGERGWWGTKRHTSEDIAELRDSGMSYEQIDKGLNDIIEDHGKENSAAAKRVELQLNDRLRNGYRSFMTGKQVQPNQDYIYAVNESEANRAREEAFNALVDNGARYAPVEDVQASQRNGAHYEGERKTEKYIPKPEIKGTGAAERNFSGTAAYDDLLSDDNVQRERKGAVRSDEVPKHDGKGKKVSEFAGNSMSSSLTPDSFTTTIKQMVADGWASHDVKSNDQSLQEAAQAIADYGSVYDALQEVKEVAKAGRTSSKDVAVMELIYNHLVSQEGEQEQRMAADAWVTLSQLATNSGRATQIFSVFQRMTPDSQCMVLEKEVKLFAEKMKGKGHVPKDYTTRIAPELMKDYRKAAEEVRKAKTDDAKQEAMEQLSFLQDSIYQAEAAKMPATFKAKWDAWRYMCMLGNVKTQVRNIGGNLAFRPYKDVKDAIGAGLERAFIRDQSKRTKSVLTFSEADRQLLSWAKADTKSETVREALKYSAKLGDDVSGAKLEEKMEIFDAKALEAVRKFVAKVPTETDLLFKNGHYERSLAGFLKARGYTAADIQSGKVSEAVLNEGRSYAIQEAMKATFNDCNDFSDFISSFGKEAARKGSISAKVFNVAAEGVLPFRRTPANIVVRFEEYSPVGIINTLVKGAKHIRNGDVSAASVIDSLASSVTGTGALALGYMMARGLAGIKLTGSLEDEDEKRQGHQAYALEFSLGGQEYSYKIDWAAPANLPLFVGANLYNLLASESNEDASVSKFTSFLYSVGTMFEPMLALSCLSSLNSLFETGKYSDGNAIYAVAAQAATSYLTQGIPALARQTVQAFQRNKQTTFANSADPLVRDLQQLAAATGIVPALKTDAIDEWGQTEDQGNFLVRAFNAYINPGTGKRIDNSELEQEITRLNDSQPDSVSPPDTPKTISYTDSSGEQHKSHRLTEEEYNTLATVQGETAKEILDQVLESETYAAMTDQQKADVFRCVYDYAREKGRGAALPGYDGMDSWMKGIEGNAVEGILDKAMKNAFTDAFDQLNSDPAGVAEALEQAYGLIEDSYDARVAFADAAGGRIKYFITARRSGVDAETFVDLYGKFREIDGNGELNTSGKAAQWSYELQRAQEAGAITDRQKKVLKDSMVYYQMFPAETAKFDEMTEGGISADKALDIGRLMEGIKPQEGYKDVRNNQKAAAIAGSDLSPAEKAAAMKAYLPANQDENLDLMLALGYSPDDYAAVYDIYANSKKAQAIEGIRKELGVDYATARKIYDIYG